MCRRHQLYGWMLVAFGLGLLIGQCVENGFVSSCVGVGIVVIGLGVMRKK